MRRVALAIAATVLAILGLSAASSDAEPPRAGFVTAWQ